MVGTIAPHRKVIQLVDHLRKSMGYVYSFHWYRDDCFNNDIPDDEKIKEDLHKMGFSAANPLRRYKEVKNALPEEGDLNFVWGWPMWDAYAYEQELHRKYYQYKDSPKDAEEGAGASEFYDLPWQIRYGEYLRMTGKSILFLAFFLIPTITLIFAFIYYSGILDWLVTP